MQIHELPVGSPASGVQFAGDTGSQTQKIDYDALADAILNKLTTKTFDIKSESQTIIAALNALGDASKQDVANNLVTTAAGLVLDARQGKALKDLHDSNASDISALSNRVSDLIKTKRVTYTNQSFTINNNGYVLLDNESFLGLNVISVNIMSWLASTGAWGVAFGSGNVLYIIGTPGVTVTQPVVDVAYTS